MDPKYRWTSAINGIVKTVIGVATLIAAVPALAAPERMETAEITVDQMAPDIADAYTRGIQEELAAHGYAPGPVDGVVGGRTKAAIRSYQRDAGLPVTGNASKELLDHLKFAVPKVYASKRPTPIPQELVRDVQQQLYSRGYYDDTIDGLAGPNTRSAVRAFQGEAGLPVTGVVDQRLLSELKLADPSIRAN